MSFWTFVVFFIVGLVGDTFLVSVMGGHPFLIGLINGLLIGILGAKD